MSRLPDISLLPNRNIALPKQVSQGTGDCKENTIHDSKCETGLQHCTLLVHIKIQSRDTAREPGVISKGNASAVHMASSDMSTIGVDDAAQFVYTGYEGAYEAEVDKRYKVGV